MRKLIFAAVVFASTSAFAHVNMSDTSATRTPLYSATPTNTSNTSAIWKAQVKGGVADAPRVLVGGEPTDLFNAAIEALENLTGDTYATSEEAAMALIVYVGENNL